MYFNMQKTLQVFQAERMPVQTILFYIKVLIYMF